MTESRTTRRPRVLVLGATGYIGNNILRAFSTSAQAEVVVGCRQPDRLGPAAAGKELRVGDLRDAGYRRSVFEGVDVVCFASAWSALHGRARESHDNFLLPTRESMTAAAAAGVRRILFTSAVDVNNVAHSVSRAVREHLSAVWPHLANVMAIEAHMASLAEQGVECAAIRCGYFVGSGSTFGILPVLLPRLRARLVPYIDRGGVGLRVVDGRDVGEAFRVVAMARDLAGFRGFDVVAEASPTFRELLMLLHAEHGYPLPWFNVSYATAHRFAWFAEAVARVTRTQPILTRSIVFLSEPARVDPTPLRALGFAPQHTWQSSVREQVSEIHAREIPSRMVDARAPLLRP